MNSAARAMAAPEVAAKAGDGGARAAAQGVTRGLRLQRACSCGGSCDSCKKKAKEGLQRKAVAGAGSVVAKVPSIKGAAAKGPAGSSAAKAEVPQAAKTPPARGAAPAPKMTENKKVAGEGDGVPAVVKRVLETAGQPLDAQTRFGMEGRFGRNFGDVRVHTDALAAESARAVSAHAYTVGQHIVFDAGLYQPATPEGRKLLAHELAHTVQQHGLQKSADISMETGGEYQQLEREADRVSAAVTAQGPARAGAPLWGGRSTGARVSRTGKGPAETQTPLEEAGAKREEKDNWVPVPPGSALHKLGAEYIARPEGETGLVAFKMWTPLEIPLEKGTEALKLWDAQAKAGALQSFMAPGGSQPTTKTAVKQDRPGPDKLRSLWLQKMGWPDKGTEIETDWKAAAIASGSKDGESTFQPSTQVGGTKCDLDHIVELQFGGNNVPMNIQVLDSSPNRSSGSQIGQDLKNISFNLQKAMSAQPGGTSVNEKAIRLQFNSVAFKKEGSSASKCVELEKVAKKGNVKDLKNAAAGTRYPMRSGAFNACVVAGDHEDKVTFAAVTENASASTLVPGLVLESWSKPKNQTHPETCGAEVTTGAVAPKPDEAAKPAAAKGPAKAAGHVTASIDTKSRNLSALTVAPNQKVDLTRDSTGQLFAPKKDPKIAFLLNYLSPGVIHKLTTEADGSLSGAGTITPTLKFLPQFDFEFTKDKFVMSKQIPKEKLKLSIPGVEITDADVGLQIAPEFKPTGHVAFLLNAGAKKLLDGDVSLSADENGLVAKGKVHAFLPGVDNAEGELELRNKIWTGKVEIETTQMQSRLKYVKSGKVTVVFTNEKPGMMGTGTVHLALPGTDGVEASLHYDGESKRWSFKGTGKFQIPKLKEAELHIEYDGDHLTGGTGPQGIAFEFHGIDGVLHLQYRDEKFSGAGKLELKKGKTTGSIAVVMRQAEDGSARFSGKGELTYRVTEDLIATASIEIDEQEKTRVLGALSFPKPIPLFKPIEGHYKFFEIGLNIPIPGASIGPVGLQARIDGSLSAGYKLGPGELRDTKVQAAFNPLDEKPDVDVLMTSTLYIGANAYISGRIAGSIVVDAGLASVSGGLAITATAALDGHVGSQVTIHYQQSRIEMDANFEMMAGLAITLALDAFVKAHAGIAPFSVDREKDWNLATYKYDTGMQFGMKLKNPIHYASDQPTKMPSFDDIEWTVPKIDPGNVLTQVFGNAGAKEQEHAA